MAPVTLDNPMAATVLEHRSPTALRAGRDGAGSDRFADLLAGAGPRDAQALTEAEARTHAEQLVGFALFLPLLKQARESPFRTELFHGGQGEQAFGGQMDQILAERMSKRANLPIVDRMVDQLMKRNPSPSGRALLGGGLNLHG
jgi:Rod binding domain-containing protein